MAVVQNGARRDSRPRLSVIAFSFPILQNDRPKMGTIFGRSCYVVLRYRKFVDLLHRHTERRACPCSASLPSANVAPALSGSREVGDFPNGVL